MTDKLEDAMRALRDGHEGCERLALGTILRELAELKAERSGYDGPNCDEVALVCERLAERDGDEP